MDDYGIRKTTALTIVLTNLQRFTNYSIEILGFTKIGDGVYSKPIYCITEEDGNISSLKFKIWFVIYYKIEIFFEIVAPGPPEDIKVFPTSQQSLLISWLPPAEPNGIITKYNLYTRFVWGHCWYTKIGIQFFE